MPSENQRSRRRPVAQEVNEPSNGVRTRRQTRQQQEQQQQEQQEQQTQRGRNRSRSLVSRNSSTATTSANNGAIDGRDNRSDRDVNNNTNNNNNDDRNNNESGNSVNADDNRQRLVATSLTALSSSLDDLRRFLGNIGNIMPPPSTDQEDSDDDDDDDEDEEEYYYPAYAINPIRVAISEFLPEEPCRPLYSQIKASFQSFGGYTTVRLRFSSRTAAANKTVLCQVLGTTDEEEMKRKIKDRLHELLHGRGRPLRKEEADALLMEERFRDLRDKAEDQSQVASCAICLDAFREAEVISRLKCGHTLHGACARRALIRKACCPLCRDCTLCSKPDAFEVVYVDVDDED